MSEYRLTPASHLGSRLRWWGERMGLSHRGHRVVVAYAVQPDVESGGWLAMISVNGLPLLARHFMHREQAEHWAREEHRARASMAR